MTVEDPIERFVGLFAQAQQTLGEAGTAFCLATVHDTFAADARILLLKGVDADGFVFFSNYRSAKARQLEARSAGTMCYFWPSLNHQVRVRGPIAKVSAAESDAYFASRPRGSQLGAWASAQSEALASFASLDQQVKAAEERFGDGPIPRPPGWGGYRLVPLAIEFWRAELHRLHRRELYERHDAQSAWAKRLLSP